jgi:hypothetical protein
MESATQGAGAASVIAVAGYATLAAADKCARGKRRTYEGIARTTTVFRNMTTSLRMHAASATISSAAVDRLPALGLCPVQKCLHFRPGIHSLHAAQGLAQSTILQKSLAHADGIRYSKHLKGDGQQILEHV